MQTKIIRLFLNFGKSRVQYDTQRIFCVWNCPSCVKQFTDMFSKVFIQARKYYAFTPCALATTRFRSCFDKKPGDFCGNYSFNLSPYSTFPFFTGTLTLKAIPRSALMTRILLKYITVSPAGPKLLAGIVAVLFRQPSLLTATSCE